MKNISRVLCSVAMMAAFPAVAGAAGTYYNGNLYQNPQGRYGMNGSNTGNNNGGGFYNNYGANNYNGGRGYGQSMQQNPQGMQNMGNRKVMVQVQQAENTFSCPKNDCGKKQGFYLDAGLSHQFASWNLEMNKAGSKLHYDNLRWNVFGADGAYYFGTSTPMQIKVGASYGMQFGDSSMVDDDISTEKMWEIQRIDVSGTEEDVLIGSPALSVGTSNGGTQMGFNASFGLTDLFSMGRVKVTPSIGYRYFKHELKTKKNYGMMINVLNSSTFVNCLEVEGGEIQCSPYVGFVNGSGEVFSFASLSQDENGNIIILNNPGATELDVGYTYYYEQAGTSHKYETTWMGPYIALDMEYAVNNNNYISGGIEFGLPIYESKGDQPYRIDWAHPTSVEDKGSFGDAYHLGLNAAWTTKMTDSVGLVLGFTYDYYKVSGASATTYFNSTYYTNLYNNGLLSDEDYAKYSANNWSAEDSSEIDSIYKSMGIRAGIEVKF
ncbi:MAG: hypothetical protein J6W08_00250 [Alphaproteobacteria bacterium]|nr:hypothetical protein [Alphaproteobacteria bacterium]